MAEPTPVEICGAVEGLLDEAIITRLIRNAGGTPGPIFPKHGKPELKKKIAVYNQAARRRPWVVLVDLDRPWDCAPQLRSEFLPAPAPFMCFRIAVRAVEAWLLADGEGLAKFLGARIASLPPDPEALLDPKQALVDLARRSRRTAVREDIVPRPGTGSKVGESYNQRLIRFVSELWRPQIAARKSESLRRCNRCLRRLLKSWQERTAPGTK